MLQVSLNERNGTHHDSFGLLFLLTSSSSCFLFLPLRLGAQKGEDGLSHAAEGSPKQSLQNSDGCSFDAEHKADSIRFLLALIHSPISGVQTPVPPIGRKSIQAHNFEPGALLSHYSRRLILQPFPGFYVLAVHNVCPL